jgi:NAD(P)-dependent dehydrogenase (short-subunit alcohol dehydrogenase family)
MPQTQFRASGAGVVTAPNTLLNDFGLDSSQRQGDVQADRRQIEAGIPFGQRMTTTAEIANMVTFLLSPQSSHTTGHLIHVDGEYPPILIISRFFNDPSAYISR